MPLPLIPVAVAGLGALAGFKAYKRRKKGMTPARQKIYDQALTNMKDPVALRKLAAGYHKEGLTEQGTMLQKRARLRELPADVKQGRRDAFKKGMTLTDPAAVEKLAKAFADEGATGAAAELRKYGAGLARKTT